ncbi:hypothetical protein B0H10DRAFT_2036407 [Mycena sp. CBHHK59/15]|nr:hypothetical protein B0H10DRAFT_2036407 [Mycena sp. CBHHK59/15]
MTSALTRLTENMAPRKRGLEDVWFSCRLCSQGLCDGEANESSVCLMDFLVLSVVVLKRNFGFQATQFLYFMLLFCGTLSSFKGACSCYVLLGG